MTDDLTGLTRKTRNVEEVQEALFPEFDVPDWKAHWWGMPSFEQKDARPEQSITVHFMCFEDVREFAKRLGFATITRQTDSVWFPPDVVDAPSAWEYTDAS